MPTAADLAARSRLEDLNAGPETQRNMRDAAQIRAYNQGVPSSQQIDPNNRSAQLIAFNSRVNELVRQQSGQSGRPVSRNVNPIRVGSGSSRRYSSGGGGRGGGGGGGAPAPKMNQAQLDWVAAMMRGAAPAPFDPTIFNQARTALTQGQATDVGTANTATQNMLNFLNTNYSNPFNTPGRTYATAGTAPGVTPQGMMRMLRQQGVNPNRAGVGQYYNQAANADQAFGNMWRTLAGNEDLMQRGRIGNANLYGSQARDAINAAAAGGQLGINLGQGQAQQAWQERMDAYRNAEMQAMLGLLPQLIQNPGLHLPGVDVVYGTGQPLPAVPPPTPPPAPAA